MTLTDEEYLRLTAEHNNNNSSEECRGMNKCVFIAKDGKCISNTNNNLSSDDIFLLFVLKQNSNKGNIFYSFETNILDDI